MCEGPLGVLLPLSLTSSFYLKWIPAAFHMAIGTHGTVRVCKIVLRSSAYFDTVFDLFNMEIGDVDFLLHLCDRRTFFTFLL